MPDILHRVGIGVKPQHVFKALTTTVGLRHWWVASTKGNANKGGTIDFGFCHMKVVGLSPNKLVKWQCVKGPKEWKGTTVTFQLKPQSKQTFVLFTHANWKEPVEFMHHCSTKWAIFLLSLKNWLERGEGRPAPFDEKIHLGD